MSSELVLLSTAVGLGFIHTVLGPDHYLPFIVMSRARKWTPGKTALITLLCGLGHVLSSVAIGVVGVAFGVAVMKLEALEGIRGNIAGWLLVAFGATYLAWGIHRAVRNRPHSHAHVHEGAVVHTHEHPHIRDHAHVHDEKVRTWKSLTPWVLFTVFVFGPCEPLIPIVMYPAAKHSLAGLASVTAVFGGTTILTMLAIVMPATWGMGFLRFARMERYAHALAGGAILACGLAVQFLGL